MLDAESPLSACHRHNNNRVRQPGRPDVLAQFKHVTSVVPKNTSAMVVYLVRIAEVSRLFHLTDAPLSLTTML